GSTALQLLSSDPEAGRRPGGPNQRGVSPMHPDLPKLLDVQGKDRRLSEVNARHAELVAERASLGAALDAARQQIAQTERAAADTARRRDEREAKLEAQRALQDKRRARLDQE